MRYLRVSLIFFSLTLIWFCFQGCEKQRQPITITLYDKPLSVIQSYIKGKWRLEYAIGGFWPQKHTNTNNSYLILSPDHIIIGNDSTGIVVDTTIVWVKSDIGSNNFTYLLSYSWYGYMWPEYKIIDQIKNDTLKIRDTVDDGYSYYYSKY